MPDKTAGFYVGGSVGERAVVQQGSYLYNITVQPKNVDDAKKILRFVDEQRAKLEQPGLPRQLKPEVFVNRWQELKEIEKFFEDDNVMVLYISGIAGIGKSTLVRGALETSRPNVPVIWINCRGLNIDGLLLQINAGFNLGVQAILKNITVPMDAKVDRLLKVVKNESILVLDDLDALLNNEEKYQSTEMQIFMTALCTLEHKLKVLITTSRLPHNVNEASGEIQILRLTGLSNESAKEHFKRSADQVKLLPSKIDEALKTKAFKKINGHPLFIELFASTLRDLPVNKVEDELFDASEIGEYIMEQTLKGLSPEELKVLQVAARFRQEFNFEALNDVFGILVSSASSIGWSFGEKIHPKTMRALIRQSLIECISDKQNTYYIHPLLRDAVPYEEYWDDATYSALSIWYSEQSSKIANYVASLDISANPLKVMILSTQQIKFLNEQVYHYKQAEKIRTARSVNQKVDRPSKITRFLKKLKRK